MRRVREALAVRPELVLWLVAAYYVIAVVVRVVRTEGLQNDEAEQLFLSQFLLTGYGRQPPLYNWIQHAVISLVGPSILALSIVKNALLFLSCLFYGMAAEKVTKQKGLAAIAMLGIIALPTICILAQRDLTHAIATIFAVSLFLYAFLGTLTKPTLWSYTLTGIAVGLGMISKYNFVLVPAAAMLAILPEPELRRRLYDCRMLAAIVVAGVICLPHGLWLIDNFHDATAGTIDAMRDDATGNPLADRWSGLSDLVVSILDSSLAPIAFYLIVFRLGFFSVLRAGNVCTRVIGRIIVISLILVCLIAVVGIGASTISQKWLSPFLLMMPLYLCLKLDAAGPVDRQATGRMAIPVFILSFGFLIYLTIGTLIAPLTGSYPKDSLPSGPFLRQVIADEAKNGAPAYVIAGDMALAGTARIELPDAPVILPNVTDVDQSTLLDANGYGLVIWQPRRQDKSLPPRVAAFLADQGLVANPDAVRILEVPYLLSHGKATTPFAYLALNKR